MSTQSSPHSQVQFDGFPEGQFLQRKPEGASWAGTIRYATIQNGSLSGAIMAPDARILDPSGAVCSACKVTLVPVAGNPGAFNLSLSKIPAGGPYTLELTDSLKQRVERSFYAGDLWIMAGQSNMEGVGLMEDAALPHPLVRNFTMAREWTEAREPLHWLPESPDLVHNNGTRQSPEAARDGKARALKGSGVGLHFARQMLEITGVPQGLVSCAHGGTSMAQWSPEQANQGGASLYGSLLLSIQAVNQPAAGVLWYQGCSDANIDDEKKYTQRMIELVGALRTHMSQPDLPWLTVQIGKEIGRSWQTGSWHSIQEQQRLLPGHIHNLDVCASADLEHDDWIHISGKSHQTLARRLVHLARILVLKDGFPEPAPQVLRARWAPDHISPAIEIECTNIAGDLSSPGRPLGFTLADEALKEHRLVYQTRFKHNRITLRLTGDDLNGLSVFHGLDTEALVNTCDGRGLPLPVFGPLPIEGLPPVSSWFRSWHISPAISNQPLGDIKINTHPQSPDWTFRRFEGWNVINMKDDWKDHQECRVFKTMVEVPEAMELEVQAGGDGALRVWFDDHEVITDLNETADLGYSRTSKSLKAQKGLLPIHVAMSSRGGLAWGFYLRLHRLDQTAGAQAVLLPRERNVHD